MASFRDMIREISPPWLKRKWGERYLYAFGLTLDGVTHWAIEGMRSRFPGVAPEDALPFIARDRKITRGFAESVASHRSRLKAWREIHRWRGNAYSLLRKLRAYCTGYPMIIRTVNDRGSWQTIGLDGTEEDSLRLQFNWDWDGRYPTLARTRWWVIIHADPTLWGPGDPWGTPGRKWGEPGRTWGSTMTSEQARAIRELVREEKPGGSRCRYIILAFDAASFDPLGAPGAPLPDGTWGVGGAGVYFSAEVAGSQVPTRLDTARYGSA